MEPSLDMTKETIGKIVDFMNENYSSNEVRFAFVGYRDVWEGEEPMVVQDFSSDTEALKKLIAEQNPSGGGDACEDLLGGLKLFAAFLLRNQTLPTLF